MYHHTIAIIFNDLFIKNYYSAFFQNRDCIILLFLPYLLVFIALYYFLFSTAYFSMIFIYSYFILWVIIYFEMVYIIAQIYQILLLKDFSYIFLDLLTFTPGAFFFYYFLISSITRQFIPILCLPQNELTTSPRNPGNF